MRFSWFLVFQLSFCQLRPCEMDTCETRKVLQSKLQQTGEFLGVAPDSSSGISFFLSFFLPSLVQDVFEGAGELRGEPRDGGNVLPEKGECG